MKGKNTPGYGTTPISGEEFEKLIVRELFDLNKNDSLIEPNISFLGKITPSAVDKKAEFDVFIHSLKNVNYLIECKARKVKEFDIYKLDVQSKRVGVIKSNLRIISTEGYDRDIKDLAFNMGIQLETRDIIKSARKRNISPRKYIHQQIKNHEFEIYERYHQAALEIYPSYYLFLNNCWIPQYSSREETLQQVMGVMELMISQSKGNRRKLFEFIYIKAAIIRNWIFEDHKEKIFTKDIIELISLNKSNKLKDQNEKMFQFKKEVEEKLSNNISLSIDPHLNVSHFFSNKLVEFKRERGKEKGFEDLYIIIGFDRYIFNDLLSILKNMFDIYHFKNIYLLDTIAIDSFEASKIFYSKFLERRFMPYKLKDCNIHLINMSEHLGREFNLSHFIEFVNSKASKNAALLITYIPKLWILHLFRNKKEWKYFFSIDRPISMLQWIDRSTGKEEREIRLKAYELIDRFERGGRIFQD